MFDPTVSYTVEMPDGDYKKLGCKYVTRIPRGVRLSDDEIKLYFHIDESHELWHRMQLPRAYPRLVFDKCVFPEAWLASKHVIVTQET